MGADLDALRAKHVPLATLVERLHDRELRLDAESALEHSGAPAVEALWEALVGEKSRDRRIDLKLALETVAGKDAVALMIERLPIAEIVARLHDPEDTYALEALERLGAPAAAAIFDAHDREPDADQRSSLEGALAFVGEGALPVVLETLRNGGSRRRLLLARAQIYDLEPTTELLDALVSRLVAEPDLVDPDDWDFYLDRFAPLGQAAVEAARARLRAARP
jgi:hypothetical protein